MTTRTATSRYVSTFTRPIDALTAVIRPLRPERPRPSPRPVWTEPRYDVLGDSAELNAEVQP